MATPYSRNSWEIDLFRHSDTIFFNVVLRDETIDTEFEKRASYWGKKFEEYCTEGIDSQPDPNEFFCSIVSFRVRKYKILLAAEIDCYEQITTSSTKDQKTKKRQVHSSYIELKTNKLLDEPRAQSSFDRYKTLSIWIQSYLAAVPKVICGLRTDNGSVIKINTYKTHELADIGATHWDWVNCLVFLEEMLSTLKEITKHNERYTLKFEGSEIKLDKSSKPGTFLPNEFIIYLDSLVKK